MNKLDLHIAVANNKGGAGKTSTIIQLANAFSETGLRSIVIDCDKNRTCRNWSQRRKLNDLPERFKVLSMVEAQKFAEPKDVVLYDTEGGIQNTDLMDLAQMSNFIVIPCKPDAYNLEATTIMTKIFGDLDYKFRVLITDAMPNNGFHRAREVISLLEELKVPYFKEIVPRSTKFVDAGNEGRTVDEMYGSRFITDKFSAIVEQILTDIGVKIPAGKTELPNPQKPAKSAAAANNQIKKSNSKKALNITDENLRNLASKLDKQAKKINMEVTA